MQNNSFMKVLSGPLNIAVHAIIHTIIFQAIQNAGLMKMNAQKIIQSIPPLSVSPEEYNEVQSAQDLLELEASFGAGTFYVVDAQQDQKVYVFHQVKVAQYASSIISGNKKQGQNQQNQDSNEQENTGKKGKQNGDTNQQVLAKLQQILETLTQNSNG